MAKQAPPPTEEAAPEAAPPPPKSRKKMVLVGIFVGVMAVEGVGVFILAKHMSPEPATAEAAAIGGLDEHGGKKAPLDTEIDVGKLRAQNEKSQQLMVYDMSIAMTVAEKDASRISEVIDHKKATIQDRLGRVVRSLDPQRFSEPDLATLRSQFKHELGQIVGDEEAVKEVLIPSIVKYNDQ